METYVTVVEGVDISPDSDTSAATTGYQSQSIGAHSLLHLWRETDPQTANANKTRYSFNFRALVVGQREFDDTDNAILLPEIDVALADGITFHPLHRPTHVITLPPNGAAI